MTTVTQFPKASRKLPGQWAAEGDGYDCTGFIGQLGNECEWPMFSFERPASIVWNAVAAKLNKRGWSDAEIQTWLQSKETRWALDGQLGDLLAAVADVFAASATKVEE